MIAVFCNCKEMRLLILFVALIAFSFATEVPSGACPGSRGDLLGCFDQLIDLDHNDTITVAELDHFITNRTDCLPSQAEFRDNYNSSFIMTQCDKDSNGYLDAADWNHADACIKWEPVIDYICRLCYMCDWVGVTK